MSRKLLILAAILSIALITPSFAAVNNIKVSGDITAQGITRDLTLGLTDTTDRDTENFLLSQVRIRFDADLTDNVSAVIRLINERIWGRESSSNTDIDLDLAYITLHNFLADSQLLAYPVTLIIGRQELSYGNGLIVGDPDTNQGVRNLSDIDGYFGDLSLRKFFDAIRAIIDLSDLLQDSTLDLIYAVIAENKTTEADDVILYGANFAHNWASYNGITEIYFFGADNSPLYDLSNSSVTPAEDQSNTYVVGSRVMFSPNDRLTLGAEAAYEFGDVYVSSATSKYQHLSAYAVQLVGQYNFADQHNTSLSLSYTYLSGDDDANDDDYNAWDPLFENQTPAEIINLLAANTNSHFIRLEASMMPKDDVTLGLIYAKAILAEKYSSSTYSPSLGPASGNTYAVDRNENNFGDEVDAYIKYDYTEDVYFKLTGAWFFPGDFFASDNDSLAYSIRGTVGLSF